MQPNEEHQALDLQEYKQQLLDQIRTINPTLLGMSHPMVRPMGEFVVDEETDEGEIISGHWEWDAEKLDKLMPHDLERVKRLAEVEEVPDQN